MQSQSRVEQIGQQYPEGGRHGSALGSQRRRRLRTTRSAALLLMPALVLFFAVFVLPQANLLRYSFLPGSTSDATGLTLENYSRFFGDSFYISVLGRTLRMGIEVTLITLVLGYPLAYWLARMGSRWKTVLLTLTIFPLLSSAVVRSFGWMVLLYRSGPVDRAFIWLGISDRPEGLMYTFSGVVIAMAEVLMPFMVLTLYSVIQSVDPSLEQAAMNLGAGPLTTLLRVTVPLTRGGILAGSLLVFSLAISSFVTPVLVGGARVQLMATLIQEQTISVLNWEFAAAVAAILLVVVLGLALLYARLVEPADTSDAQVVA